MNIVRLGVYEQSLYKPPYAYLVQIPQQRSYYFSYDVMFMNDCHYIMPCQSYCAYNIFYDDDWLSCLEGCYIFDQRQNCNCDYYDGPENFWDDLNDDFGADTMMIMHGHLPFKWETVILIRQCVSMAVIII